jgi:hypothetical protein
LEYRKRIHPLKVSTGKSESWVWRLFFLFLQISLIERKPCWFRKKETVISKQSFFSALVWTNFFPVEKNLFFQPKKHDTSRTRNEIELTEIILCLIQDCFDIKVTSLQGDKVPPGGGGNFLPGLTFRRGEIKNWPMLNKGKQASPLGVNFNAPGMN